MLGLSEIHTFSPSMVNEARIGIMGEWNPAYQGQLGTPFWEKFGITPLTTSIDPGLPHVGPPTTAITSFNGFSNSLFVRNDPHWQLSDTFSWTRSRHTIKLGTNATHHGTNLLPPTAVSGSISFTNTSSGPTSTYGLADVLLGLPASTTL